MLTPLDLTGVLLPVSIMAGFVMALIAYRAQVKWYGDDHDSAVIKAGILGLLTAIPTPIPAALYLTSGALGLIRTMGRK